MSEVSCRALEFFFRELRKKGLDPEVLAKDSDCRVDQLRDKHEWISWRSFAAITART